MRRLTETSISLFKIEQKKHILNKLILSAKELYENDSDGMKSIHKVYDIIQEYELEHIFSRELLISSFIECEELFENKKAPSIKK